MKLIKPNEETKQAYLSFEREWKERGEEPLFSFISEGESYEEWLQNLREMESDETCPKSLVPATTYLLEDEGVILGIINLRHRLNENLLRFGGNIGYAVRPSARRKGCASLMLKLVLPIAKELGLSKVLITCDKSNIGSAKTIQNNGGTLENEEPGEGRITQRYWIDLD